MNRAIVIVGLAVSVGATGSMARAAKVASGAREACAQARNVSSGTVKAKRCVKDDTKERGSGQRILAPMEVLGNLMVDSSPGDPFTIDATISTTITPGAAVDAGTISFWGFATVSGVTGPGYELGLGGSYTEPILSETGATLRYVPHAISPGAYAVVSLLDAAGNPLATKTLDLSVSSGGEALFSMATPGTYGIAADLWWTSGPLPVGGSAWVSPTVGVDVSFLTFASCPADLNADQVVEDLDFVVFASAYDMLDCADPAMPLGCPADFNHDGIVEDGDFVVFAAAYDVLVCE